MIAAGGIAGAGVVLMLRGLIGTTTPLAAIVAELHRPRIPAATPSRADQFAGVIAGRPTPGRDADLAVCERSADRFVRDRLLWMGIVATPGLFAVMLAAAGSPIVPAPVTVLAIPAGVGAGWFYARVDLHSDAERARREFRHALSGYLELVTILMAGGAGVETALFDAAAAGDGTAFRHLRAALSAAQARREPPWRTFGELGVRLGVSDLEELEASMTLAGGGAQVRDSLTAKAAGIRMRDLGQLESEAQSRSETMVLPVVLMFAGFLVLIGYPALAALSTP